MKAVRERRGRRPLVATLREVFTEVAITSPVGVAYMKYVRKLIPNV